MYDNAWTTINSKWIQGPLDYTLYRACHGGTVTCDELGSRNVMETAISTEWDSTLNGVDTVPGFRTFGACNNPVITADITPPFPPQTLGYCESHEKLLFPGG